MGDSRTGVLPDVAMLRRYLAGLDYPSDRVGVIEHARRLGATGEDLRRLAALPNRTYEGPNAVNRALLDT